ncbi:MAG: DUF4175 family protein, partial [Pseudomonadota bacterium]
MSPKDSDQDPGRSKDTRAAGWRDYIQSRLDTLIGQSRVYLFVERLWRALLPVLVVVGIYVGLSWLGLWMALPVWIGLA